MKCLNKWRGCCSCISQRYVTMVMAALGLSFMYALRNSFGLALTQMVIHNNTAANNTVDRGLNCPPSEDEIKGPPQTGEFNWSPSDFQTLLSAYFIGYAIAHLPGGMLGDHLGGKIALNSGLFVGGICCLLTPISAKINFWLLFVVRGLMGLGHGMIFPGLSSLVAMWAPPNERSLMSAITYSGITFGSSAGISLAGAILGWLPGWEPVFYIFGASMIVWCFAFYVIGYSRPSEHPYITRKEWRMIENAISVTSRKRPDSIPWRRIMTSPPFIALLLINFGHTWIVFFIGIQLPIYLKTVVNFDIVGSGLSAALPYVAMWVSGMFTGIFSDWTIKRGILSTTNNRKIFAVLSNYLPLPFFIGASYAGCDKNLCTAFFTIMMFFNGLTYSSLKVNAVDLSPNYAGLLMGIANGVSAFGGALLPYVITLFVDKDHATVQDWRKVFFVSGTILVVLTLPYACFASGRVQPWNSDEEEEEEEPRRWSEERASLASIEL